MIDLLISLYARIILSCAFGLGKSDVSVKREQADGTFKEYALYEAMTLSIEDTASRGFNPFQLLFPELGWWTISPHDRRYGRNIKRVKDVLQDFINERR